MNDPVASLEALTRMRERGLVDEAEYQAKRAEILGRLGGPAPSPAPAPAPAPGSPWQRLVRVYHARSEPEAEQQMAADRAADGYSVEHRTWRTTSPGRMVATPVILMVAGALIAGLTGVLIGGVVGILYLLAAVATGGQLTVTYRKR
jgi:hypothetical protein